MKGKFVEFIRSLRDPVRARRQEKIREVELTWSDHDLSNFRVFALGIQPGEMADVCFALADGSAIPLLELLVDYAGLNEELMRIAFQSLEKTPLSARLFLSKRLLASKKAPVRAAACRMLSGASASAPDLEAALGDASDLVVAAAIRALVSIGYAKAEKRLLARLKSGAEGVRLLALDALAGLHGRSGAFEKAALGILADGKEKPALREKAAGALSAMGSASGRAALLAMLGNAALEEETRCLAARTLAGYDDADSAAALLDTARSGSRALASAARQALSGMLPAVVLSVCGAAIGGNDAARALAAAEILGGLPGGGAARLLAERLGAEEDAARIAALAEALGKSGEPRAWGAIRGKLSVRPDCAAALVASLADCASRESIDDFAGLVDALPDDGAREIALRRLAAFCRGVRPTPAVLRRALAMADSADAVMRASAVEILAYSGEPSLRLGVLQAMAALGEGYPVRRLLRVMLGQCDGELATLFEGAAAGVSALLPDAAAVAASMGRGGMEFFIKLASWARRGARGAAEGLATAAILAPWPLVEAMRLSPDRVFLLDAWAELPRRERLRHEPDLDQLFAAASPEDRLRALEILSRVGEEKYLRTAAMLAFSERDEGIRAAALGLVRRLIAAEGRGAE